MDTLEADVPQVIQVQKQSALSAANNQTLIAAFAQKVPQPSMREAEIAAPFLRERPRRSDRQRPAVPQPPKPIVSPTTIPNWSSALMNADRLRTPLPDHRVPIHAANEEINTHVALWLGDLETLAVDAIVNAANTTIQGGGAVDYAFHKEVGAQLSIACKAVGTCPTGHAKTTAEFRLPARAVINTVGPIIHQGKKPTPLEAYDLLVCYINSMNAAILNKLPIIAFPAISTGTYNYPAEAAAYIACETVRSFLDQPEKRNKFKLLILILK
jgi:O-acetyl-ADP-ribose deacetylase (regulator of RNase III)